MEQHEDVPGEARGEGGDPQLGRATQRIGESRGCGEVGEGAARELRGEDCETGVDRRGAIGRLGAGEFTVRADPAAGRAIGEGAARARRVSILYSLVYK